MGHWGFVFLAYGIVWCSVVIYLALLKRRIRRAAMRSEQTRTEDHEPA